MKKFRSVTGMGLVALTLFMGSCVSKKKYVAAQNEIERYRTDSTQMAQRSAEMQQNIASLEERNKAIQTSYDSANKAYEARWAGIQSYYGEQRTNAEQLHQSLHQALSSNEAIGADGITSGNGKVYVTLDEKVFSGSQLNNQGRQAIAQFANAINSKDNVAVDVVTGDSYAAYWNNGSSSTASGNWSGSGTTGTTGDSSATATTGSTSGNTGTDMNDNDGLAATSSDKSATTSSNKNTTTSTNRSSGTYRSSSATKSRSTATAKKSSTAKKSYASSTKKRTGESGRRTAMRSGTKSKTTASKPSWNSTLAKATSIAKELHKNGVNNVGLMIPGGTTTSGENSNKFQLIVSPKDSRYYQMMEQNSGTQNGTQNTSGGTNGTSNQ